MPPSLIYLYNFIACGDLLETVVDAPFEEQIVLGSVQLSDGQTYTSCRNLCKINYPEFEFYHKFFSYQACDCIKMHQGYQIKVKAHVAYVFGYATACGIILKVLLSINLIKELVNILSDVMFAFFKRALMELLLI